MGHSLALIGIIAIYIVTTFSTTMFPAGQFHQQSFSPVNNNEIQSLRQQVGQLEQRVAAYIQSHNTSSARSDTKSNSSSSMMGLLQEAYSSVSKHQGLAWDYSLRINDEPNSTIMSQVLRTVTESRDYQLFNWSTQAMKRALRVSFYNKKNWETQPDHINEARRQKSKKRAARASLANKRKKTYNANKTHPALSLYQDPGDIFAAAYISNIEDSEVISRPA